MKTLTKISTATLMGLLAVVLSANAFAGKPGGHAGIDVTNDCSIDTYTKEFVVHTTITDDSDDRAGVDAALDTITVTAKQKGDRGPWGYIGAPDQDQAYIGPNTAAFPLCTGLADGATALNAEIDVVLLNGKRGEVTKSGKCDDNPDTYCSYYDADGFEIVYYCEEEDESTINVPEDLCD